MMPVPTVAGETGGVEAKHGANLAGANLTEARLSRAILTGANLEGANLKGALMPDGSVHE